MSDLKIASGEMLTLEQIIARSGTKDHSVYARMFEILDLCSRKSYTYDELADEFEVHYQTIYKNVQFLHKMGLLRVDGKKVGRKMRFYTDLTRVKGSDGELHWTSIAGELHGISYWINRFLETRDSVKNQMVLTSWALVAIRENKRLRESGDVEYGEEFDAACREVLSQTKFVLESILFVVEQGLDSPVFNDPDSHKLFKLPDSISPDEANKIHDQLQVYFLENNFYED